MGLKRVFSLLVLLFCQNTYSEIVMPVLYGWYTEVEYDFVDACLQEHYKYKNLDTSSSFELAQKVLSAPQRSDCLWGGVILQPMNRFKPVDFPGTYEQWQDISKNTSAITQGASRPCVDSKGKTIYEITTDIFPVYRCPQGSMYSLEFIDDAHVEFGCTTKPSGCFANIIGRDLDTKITPEIMGIKDLGHIGLTEAAKNQSVMEVLNEPGDVVQNNSIESFKNKTKYWGQKYGTPQKNNLTIVEGANILAVATEQKLCSPEYTMTWSFSPCSSGKPAKFRCDSFVYYAYLKGADIDLGYTPLVTYPSTIFNSMVNCRDETDSPCINGFVAPDKTPIKDYVLKPSIILAKNISALLSENQIDIEQLDKASRAYLMAEDESRENKINLLWDLLIRNQKNPLKYAYLADILAELEPIEKTNSIIQKFQKTNDLILKLKYLTLLISSMTLENVKEQAEHAYNAKIFIMKLLQTSQNEDILRVIIVNFPESLIDDSAYYIMLDRLDEMKIQNPDDFKKIVSNTNFWYQWLGLANMNEKFNPIWVEKLFKQANKYAYDGSNGVKLVNEKRASIISKEIQRAFSFGLRSREKQNKHFHVPQSVKNNNELFNLKDKLYLPDEVRNTLRIFKEETAKKRAWKEGGK